MSVLAQAFAIIRNVLVFVPVAITWWAIGEATDKFGQHNSLKSIGEKTNFLDFWQNGYGLLDDIKLFGVIGVKIQEIAIVDSLIIVAVVVLTLLSSAIGQVADGQRDREESRAFADRDHVALVLTEAIEGKRSASPESIAGSIADVLNDLVDASREVRSAAAQLEQASMGVGSFSSQIAELNTTIGELSHKVAIQVSGELVKAVDDLSGSVARLNTAVVGDTTRLMGDVIAGLDSVTEQLERTGSSVEFGVKRLRDDLDVIHSRIMGT
jgi:methyl-accepting chemotaxis protein